MLVAPVVTVVYEVSWIGQERIDPKETGDAETSPSPPKSLTCPGSTGAFVSKPQVTPRPRALLRACFGKVWGFRV